MRPADGDRRHGRVVVNYHDLPYEVDIPACRRALVDRQVAGGLASMEGLAESIEVSRSTVSRFFAGRPTSLAVTLKILGALRVRFEDAVRPVRPDLDGAVEPP